MEEDEGNQLVVVCATLVARETDQQLGRQWMVGNCNAVVTPPDQEDENRDEEEHRAASCEVELMTARVASPGVVLPLNRFI